MQYGRTWTGYFGLVSARRRRVCTRSTHRSQMDAFAVNCHPEALDMPITDARNRFSTWQGDESVRGLTERSGECVVPAAALPRLRKQLVRPGSVGSYTACDRNISAYRLSKPSFIDGIAPASPCVRMLCLADPHPVLKLAAEVYFAKN